MSGVIRGRGLRIAIGVAAGVLVAVLIAFAIELAGQQRDDRRDIEDSFRERATISAALTQSLFEAASTTAQAENAQRYGTAEVTPETMAAGAQEGNNAYLVLLGPDGAPISASPGTPADVLRGLLERPSYIQQVIDGAPYALSNFQRFPGADLETYDLVAPVETELGRRLLVSGVSPQLLSVFLGGYLTRVPNVGDGAAYLLDANGAVVAATVAEVKPGDPPADTELSEAVADKDQGSFGDDRYFVSSPVEGSPWEVVSTAPESELFASVSGAHKWVPWLIFTLFALASAVALLLLMRVARGADEIADANERLELANAALEQRAKELGRSNEELDQFASIASHDLKEPLRKVQTFTEQLAGTEAERLSEQGHDYLQRTRAAAERMQDLIDDLLKFSRVATQGRPFEPVDLGEVARQAVSDLQAVIDEAGGSVEIGELPTVAADPLQMRQLLQNLISNAVKFHREGVPPEVSISSRSSGRFAELEVSDNGIGFEPKYNTRIFRVFERLHGRGAFAGTGIGLALCRKIVDRHGGAIIAESTPGEGSTFTVRLPLEQAEPPDPGVAAQDNGNPTELTRAHA